MFLWTENPKIPTFGVCYFVSNSRLPSCHGNTSWMKVLLLAHRFSLFVQSLFVDLSYLLTFYFMVSVDFVLLLHLLVPPVGPTLHWIETKLNILNTYCCLQLLRCSNTWHDVISETGSSTGCSTGSQALLKKWDLLHVVSALSCSRWHYKIWTSVCLCSARFSCYSQLVGRGTWLCSRVFIFFSSISYAKGVL